MFTMIGKLIAVLVTIGCALLLLSGVLFALSSDPQLVTQQYFPSRTSGQVIDQGVYLFAIGIFMGVLCEISEKLSIQKNANKASNKS